ncbi:MAG TPA: M67 family metallopeptidase [Nitrospira sp.]|nr:M67 family metallopeptidase [Nitrospira sp.]
MSDLSIPRQILDDLLAHARELDPFECCGFLAGTHNTVTRLYRIKNVVSLDGAAQAAAFDDAKVEHLARLSPEERAEIAFIMDAQEMFQAVKDMRTHGLTLQVVYHSHPHDPARPSVTDIKIANEWEENWSRLNLTLPIYLLVSLMDKAHPDVRAYWIRNGSVSPAGIVAI